MMRCCVPLDRVSVSGINDYHNFALLVGLDIEVGEEHVGWHPEQSSVGDHPDKTAHPPKHSLFSKPTLPFIHSGSNTPNSSSPMRVLSGPLRRTPSPVSTDLSPSSSSSDLRKTLSPVPRSQTKYLDSTLPSRLNNASRNSAGSDDTYHSQGDGHHLFNFNVAVLNQQAWFAQALEAAVIAARERQYRAGVTRPKMRLEVAGYDCLATDEDIETDVSASSNASEEEEGMTAARKMHKAEKAAMAAKLFGLREDLGIWSEFTAIRVADI